MKFIETLKDGDRISDIYLCKNKATATTKTGREYESVILQDKTGCLDGKIWDPSSMGIGEYEALDYVEVNGLVTSYNGALQLKIERLRRVGEGEYDPANYMPVSRFSIDDMYNELLGYIKGINNGYIKKLLAMLFILADDISFLDGSKENADMLFSFTYHTHHIFLNNRETTDFS